MSIMTDNDPPTDIEELTTIQPESWQNIPTPLKAAISLLIKHTFSLAHSLHNQIEENSKRLETALAANVENLDAKIKKTSKSLSFQVESSAAAGRRLGEGLEGVERRVENLGVKLREEIAKLADKSRADREIDSHTARGWSDDLSGKISGLQNVVTATSGELRQAIANSKSAAKYEIEEFLVNPEVKNIREEISELSLALRKAEKQLGAKLSLFEEFQKEIIREKAERIDRVMRVDEGVETTQPSLPDVNIPELDISEQISAALSAALEPLNQSLSSLSQSIETEVASRSAVISSLQSSIEQKITEKVQQLDERTDKIQEALHQSDTQFQLQLDETRKVILSIVEDKEKAMLGDLYSGLTSLEQRVTKAQESRLESDLKDIRLKLAVRTIAVAAFEHH